MNFVFLLVMMVGLFAFSACRQGDEDSQQDPPAGEEEGMDGEEQEEGEEDEENEEESDDEEEDSSDEDKLASTEGEVGPCDTSPPDNLNTLRTSRQRYFTLYYPRLEDVLPDNTESTVCGDETYLLKEYPGWDRSSAENRRPICDVCKNGTMVGYAVNQPAHCRVVYNRLVRACEAAPAPPAAADQNPGTPPAAPSVQNADNENEDGDSSGTADEN